ncbi:MAG: carbon starvation CstA family protein, partial [Staphylococcus saprophyticus]
LIAKKNFWVAAIPAVFMTWNIFTYILSQKIGLGLDLNLSYIIAFVLTILWVAYFSYQYKKITAGAKFELDYQISYKQQQTT